MNKKVKEINSFSAYEKIKKGALMIDVRELEEIKDIAFEIDGIRLLPQSIFAGSYHSLPKNTALIICCHSGNRSKEVVRFLLQKDFNSAYSLAGGIEDWIKNGFPVSFDNFIPEEFKAEDVITQPPFVFNDKQNSPFTIHHSPFTIKH